MATIKNFEDIGAWQEARNLSQEIHQLTLRENFSRDYSLKDQSLRSSGSVMDNIAEGFERGGKKEFIQFLFIAKGSAGELRSQLYRILDRKYITGEEFESLTSRTRKMSEKIMGLIKYLKTTEYNGYKSKPG